MRAIAMIATLGLALGWSSAAFSESALSGSHSKTLSAPKSEYVNQSKSSTSLGQQSQKLSGVEMQSQELTAVETKTPGKTYQKADTEAGKQVDAKFSNLASSYAKQQPPNALNASDVSLRDLSSASTSLNKGEQKGMTNKLR